MTAIWWLRRDLRLSDNPALTAALAHGAVLPLFILDPGLLGRSPRRDGFLFHGLRALDADLRARGAQLIVRAGDPLETLRQVRAESGAGTIFAEQDYTPYARRRDEHIQRALPFELIQGQTVQHPAGVLKADGNAYTVFTPYSRVWKALLPALTALPAPRGFAPVPPLESQPIPDAPAEALFPAGEVEAQCRLEDFVRARMGAYAEQRDRMDLDGTSALSPYLRFGMLSMRAAARAALEAGALRGNRGAEIWLNELIWREFYIQILFHFPRVSRESFNPALREVRWQDDPDGLRAWQAGRTGVPVVDAAMRQLAATGWMHNRARMIAASFLVKDLLTNWRWGEAWFMETLLDGDPAANNGGWQWTAGTGTDAAPYFRIFNPVLQSAKFDPHGQYIRKWVPELAHLPTDVIHAPWEKKADIRDYPQPIIDHHAARERTLSAYKLSKDYFNRSSQ